MPYMKEHIDSGIYASLGVVLLLAIGHLRGFIPTANDLFTMSLFAVIMITLGSDLPDIDSRTAPIHKIFQILVPGAVILISLVMLKLDIMLSLVHGIVALVFYTKLMPGHRQFVHTMRAGILSGGIVAILLHSVFGSLVLSVWSGFCLTFGYFVHLAKDRWVRI
ncbi:MAG: metal-dependent hydrolase [Thaumarchaeota archaeon]|nr:metal-dependent hydrolase [Nitrososphaerota archaeon]